MVTMTYCSGLLFILLAAVPTRGGETDRELQGNVVVHYIKDDPRFRLLPDPDDLARVVTGGSPKETQLFKQLYNSALELFDVEGYNWLMNKVMDDDLSLRFTQALAKIDISQPHCDKGENTHAEPVAHQAEFPGGPFRNAFGFDLTKWMTGLLGRAQSEAGSKVPGLSNMSMMSMTMLKGLIQSVAAVVIDAVPPFIPPPLWILRPLPCLPMLTGANCLGSVLYPITMSEFTTADVSDSVMNGVIGSFPAKYQSKVGKTSEAQYRICASAYLGMYWQASLLKEIQRTTLHNLITVLVFSLFAGCLWVSDTIRCFSQLWLRHQVQDSARACRCQFVSHNAWQRLSHVPASGWMVRHDQGAIHPQRKTTILYQTLRGPAVMCR
uniref:Hipothetical protein n=1 Tax=Toxoplasma gondii (strain ATCC 50861 / VEG) TaxID=432359 RepID=A0A0F7UXL8_TOXGV|nr:TPA: hipothetical protein [Toxoplasma gondii VEG]